MERIARLEMLARAGYAARGLVYLLLGYLALSSGSGRGTDDVFQRLLSAPAGTLVLVLTALGLAGYGIFRLYGGWVDLDGKGTSAFGQFQRAGQAASGIGHLLLSFFALRLALAGPSRGGGSTAEWVADLPGGTLLIGAVGALVIVAGLGNFLEAYRATFARSLAPQCPDWTCWAGRAGYAARGIVFVLVGWQVIGLAAGVSGGQPGTPSALAAMDRREWLFVAVAGGLVLFGLFSLLMAIYARIRNENVLRRLKREFAG